MYYGILFAIFMALVCPSTKHSGSVHHINSNKTVLAADSIGNGGGGSDGENGHIRP